MTKLVYEELVSKINYHMDRYYNKDNPEISDYDYDQLMLELKKIENDHPEWITKESPTQRIGEDVKKENGTKIKHDVPMLSIQDVFTKDAVVEWVNSVKNKYEDCAFSVETKIDGLSMTVRYQKSDNGKLKFILAETRGDGIEGIDVTANASVIPDVLTEIDLPYESLQLRGEVYMTHRDFENYNEIQEQNGKKTAANPRNLAAGTLRVLDPKITRERGLRMFVFNVQQGPEELTLSHCDGLDRLKESHIPVVFHRKCKNADEVISTIDEIAAMRGELDYDIDGAVVKIDQVSYRDDFPAGSKYSNGHIAYKYPPEERVVVMDDIIVDVGRTGKLTFTGVFHDKITGKPARLCGTNVSRVTLHNQDYINSKKIGIGGAYTLFKSGEIIPKLKECVEEPECVFIAPEVCPICGERLEKEDDSADIRCFNPLCSVQLTRTLLYFCSIDAMNIAGLGETLVDALVKNNYVKNFADIYKLNEKKNELILNKIIGKEKGTEKILLAIENSKKNEPFKLLAGFGIRNVGKNTAKILMQKYSSIQELQNADYNELVTITDIGDVTARSIRKFFDDEQNRYMLKELDDYGVNMKTIDEIGSGDKLNGLVFVITGTLPNLDRNQVTELIEKNGGKCTGSISKKTNYLVAGEAAGSKLTKANELAIPVISEDDLLKMLE